MNKDKLVEGPFGSNACYENVIDENTTTWMCMGSGYTTSTLMKEDSQLVKDTIETSPELYEDIKHVDKEGKVWFPATITLPGQGMVFADGTNKDDWKWSGVLTKKLTKEEIDSGKYPQGQEFKMDMENMKAFDKDKGFMDALEYIGFFQIQVEPPQNEN